MKLQKFHQIRIVIEKHRHEAQTLLGALAGKEQQR